MFCLNVLHFLNIVFLFKDDKGTYILTSNNDN